jgi:hypothetical protein
MGICEDCLHHHEKMDTEYPCCECSEPRVSRFQVRRKNEYKEGQSLEVHLNGFERRAIYIKKGIFPKTHFVYLIQSDWKPVCLVEDKNIK